MTETYYLIDFENANEESLFLNTKLTIHDHIHLFSTENVPKISLALLTAFNSAQFYSHVVAAGKQSLDMHLVAYLGYLLGATCRASSKYVVVSKDSDYDKVIAFLQSQTDADIERRATLASKLALMQAKQLAGQEKTRLNNEVQKILSKASYSTEIVGHVTKLCGKHRFTRNAKKNVFQALVTKYGQELGLNIYNLVKNKI